MSDLRNQPGAPIESVATTPFVDIVDNPQPKFYVVAPKKFFILFFITLGIYIIAWSYQNWVNFKRATKDDDIWPGPRALFCIFFMHSLGRMIEATIKRNEIKYRWDSAPVATLFVIAALGSYLLDRLVAYGIGQPITDILSLLALPVMFAPLYSFQKAANVACGDPTGASNSNFTWVNWIWIVLGSVLWLGVLIGTYDVIARAT